MFNKPPVGLYRPKYSQTQKLPVTYTICPLRSEEDNRRLLQNKIISFQKSIGKASLAKNRLEKKDEFASSKRKRVSLLSLNVPNFMRTTGRYSLIISP